MNIVVADVSKALCFNYFVKMKYEAGLMLVGWEIKSIKANGIDLLGSFVLIKNFEVFMVGTIIHVGNFVFSFNEVDEARHRKLLLNKKEIKILAGYLKIKGHTVVPAKAYFKGCFLKVELFLCVGKKLYDKRHLIKEREWNIEKGRLANAVNFKDETVFS